ncbi:hypothetical protein DY000_02039711 [Brassica cretica]|uniref:Uncharacterized protein n=1 Tax=Brassica cretica TaxID=69181 RepID=A0ABQ7BER8_BRACR|nr:hypothetical protein DY000_02039711 [Brassica cretica]
MLVIARFLHSELLAAVRVPAKLSKTGMGSSSRSLGQGCWSRTGGGGGAVLPGLRRAGSNTDSARPFAELDQVQFGNWPSWIARGFSSENVRAGSNTNSAQPFTELDQSSSVNSRAGSNEVRLYLILVTPLPRSHRAHSCFISIGGIIGTLRFKNRKNSFFLEDHSDWSYKTETVR